MLFMCYKSEELNFFVSFAATHLPVVQLNFAAVSQDSPFSREVVEGCFRETLELLYGALASQKHVSLPFKGVGILSFNNNKVSLLLKLPSFLRLFNTSSLLVCLCSHKGPDEVQQRFS